MRVRTAYGLLILATLPLLDACSQQDAQNDNEVARSQQVEPIVDLSGLLRFRRPAHCETAVEFDHLLRSLFRYDGQYDRAVPAKLVVPAAYAPAFGAPAYSRENKDAADVTIPLRGTWHGLQLARFYAYAWDGGDPGGFRLSFSEPRAKVVQVLTKLGFQPPASGANAPRDPDTEPTMTIWSAKDGTTQFGCGI